MIAARERKSKSLSKLLTLIMGYGMLAEGVEKSKLAFMVAMLSDVLNLRLFLQ